MQEQIDEAAVRETLLAERARLEHDIFERTQGDQAVVPVDPLIDSDGGAGDEADDADALSDYDRNQAITRNASGLLRQVDSALERLRQGSYGVCVRCGKRIPRRRLEALPYATMDVACQEAVEQETSEQRG